MKCSRLLCALSFLWIASCAVFDTAEAINSGQFPSGPGSGYHVVTCVDEMQQALGHEPWTEHIHFRLSILAINTFEKLAGTSRTDWCWLHWFSIPNWVDVSFWRPVSRGNVNAGDWADENGNPLPPPRSNVLFPNAPLPIGLIVGFASILAFALMAFGHWKIPALSAPIVKMQSVWTDGDPVAEPRQRWLMQFLNALDRFSLGAVPKQRGPGPQVPIWTASAFEQCLAFGLIYTTGVVVALFITLQRITLAELLAIAFSGLLFLTVSMRPPKSARTTLISVSLALSLTIFACLAAVIIPLIFVTSEYWQWLATFLPKDSIALLRWFAASLSKDPTPLVLNLGICILAIFATAVLRIDGVFGGTPAAGLPVVFTVWWFLTFQAWSDVTASVSNSAALAFLLCLIIPLGTAVLALGVLIIGIVRDSAVRYRWQGLFLSIYFVLMLLTYFTVDVLLAGELLRVLTFLGFVSLLSAPFTWIALGQSRYLMRRGLELQGPWPYLLTTANALIGFAIVAALAATAFYFSAWFMLAAGIAGSGGLKVLPKINPAWFLILIVPPALPGAAGLLIACAELVKRILPPSISRA